VRKSLHRNHFQQEIKNQSGKCKIKEFIAALRQFHNFDFLFLIFDNRFLTLKPAYVKHLFGQKLGIAI